MKGTTKLPVTFNRTDYSLDEIERLEFIGRTVSRWRCRTIRLLKHPTNPERLISDGVAYNRTERIIADELRSEWASALDCIENGKIYIYE